MLEALSALSVSTVLQGPLDTAFAAAVLLVAYAVFGMTGFGSALIAVPVLAHLWPLATLVPMIALFEIASALLVGGSQRRAVDLGEAATLLPFMLAGIAAGALLLVRAPPEWLVAGLGVFVMGYGLRGLLARETTFRRSPRWWAAPFGLVGGVVSAMFGTGGSFYVIHLAGRLEDKSALRATLSTVLGTSNAIRLAVFLATGLLLPAVAATAAVLLPVVLLGLWLGMRLHDRISRAALMRTVCALLVPAGLSLLARALAG
jgi:uncharacterized membrane protein YfcA